MKLPEEIVSFLGKQGFVLVSTIDSNGRIHCSAKGIVGVEKEGKVFVIDLYMHRTLENIKRNSTISISAVDEHRFVGYVIQGKAKIATRDEIQNHIVLKWEEKILERISKRIVKSVQSHVKSRGHLESGLPQHPKYLIEIDVEGIIDLSPPHLRK